MEKLWAIALVCFAISQALTSLLLVCENQRSLKIKELVMSLANDLNSVKEQLGKAKDEIVGKISDLESALAASGTPDPAVSAAVDSLKEVAQALDDVVPDVVPDVVVEPVDETPSE